MLARLKVWLGITPPSAALDAEVQAEQEKFYHGLEEQFPNVRFR